jgi:hypothetical protein
MADTTTTPAVDPVAALEAREAAVCLSFPFSPPNINLNLNTNTTPQVTAREQAVEKKEAELAAREAALAAKESAAAPAAAAAPAPEPAAEAEAAVCPPSSPNSFPYSKLTKLARASSRREPSASTSSRSRGARHQRSKGGSSRSC